MKIWIIQHPKKAMKSYIIMVLRYSKVRNIMKHSNVSRKYHWVYWSQIQNYGIIWAYVLSI
jgi:hypothetical protein